MTRFFAVLGMLWSLQASAAALPAAVAANPALTSAPADDASPLRLVSLTLGNRIEADKKVTAEKATFRPRDTIYAVVETTGSASEAKLSAAWFFTSPSRRVPIITNDQAIAPTGDAATEFHVAKPDGWPPGTYTVEIRLDGELAATKGFRVVK